MRLFIGFGAWHKHHYIRLTNAKRSHEVDHASDRDRA